jgi:hypothetical protein
MVLYHGIKGLITVLSIGLANNFLSIGSPYYQKEGIEILPIGTEGLTYGNQVPMTGLDDGMHPLVMIRAEFKVPFG